MKTKTLNRLSLLGALFVLVVGSWTGIVALISFGSFSFGWTLGIIQWRRSLERIDVALEKIEKQL